MLKVEQLHVSYGEIEVLHGVSIEVKAGEIVALVGANGAGKSTLLLTISGLLKPKQGNIVLNGQTILTQLKPHEIVQNRVVQVPEGRGILSKLTVYDNLLLGATTNPDKAKVAEKLEEIFQRFPILRERKDQKAGLLSGGEQQMLAIGRALLANPSILLLDEPSMGLAPIIIERIYELIRGINRSGVTVLLVEQNARNALSIAERGYVLENGKVVLEGKGADLMNDEAVVHAYLGV